MKLTERTGDLACLKMVTGEEDLILMRDDGIVMRMPVSEIPVIGRATQGVILMRVDDGTRIVCVELLPHQEDDDGDGVDGTVIDAAAEPEREE